MTSGLNGSERPFDAFALMVMAILTPETVERKEPDRAPCDPPGWQCRDPVKLRSPQRVSLS
jgi:hypothetical protein